MSQAFIVRSQPAEENEALLHNAFPSVAADELRLIIPDAVSVKVGCWAASTNTFGKRRPWGRFNDYRSNPALSGVRPNVTVYWALDG
jgi:hypothetical protein